MWDLYACNKIMDICMKMILRLVTLTLILLLPINSYAGSEIRDYYNEPGINPYKSISQHPNESISTFNGSLTLSHTDIVVPGNGGLDIKINRIYNGPISSTPLHEPAGQGWTMHFGRIVVPDSNRFTVFSSLCQASLISDTVTTIDNPSIEFADGSREMLFIDKDSQSSPIYKFITKSRVRAECLPEGVVAKGGVNMGMIVTAMDGTRYTMNEFDRVTNDGGTTYFNFFYTSRIEDTNGNWIKINYRRNLGQKVIDSIVTSDNREVRYNYINEGFIYMTLSSIEVINSNGQNQIWKYEHTADLNLRLLSKVIRPDGSEWNYGYDRTARLSPLPLLNHLTYPWGGTIDYTYKLHDFIPGLGIQRKPVIATKTVKDEIIRNNQIIPITGDWTFEYSQGIDQNGNGIIENGEFDKTTVTTPTAEYTYEHIGIFTTASTYNLWATGLPVYVTIKNKDGDLLQRTASSWERQIISSEEYTRGGGVRNDDATYAPILTSKSIFRDNVNYYTNYSNHNAYGKPETVITTSNIANESKQSDYTYFIDADRHIVKQEDEAILNVGTIDQTFDVNGNLQSVTKFGVTTDYTYFPSGDLNTETDARQNTTTYSNYHRGSAQQIDYPENVTVYRTINDSGTLKDETNGRGFTTNYRYDKLNRLAGIDYPMNDSVAINYRYLTPQLPSYPMSRELLRGNYKEEVIFDGFGRNLKTVRNDIATGEEIVTRKEYDVLGRTVFESYPNSNEGTKTKYDALNRIRKIKNVDGTKTRYKYGPGNTAIITDERDNTTELLYRSYGGPDSDKTVLRINKPQADILTSMSRNKLGQLKTAWQGKSSGTQGYIRRYEYDNRNYLTKVTNPETGVTLYGRDALGNMQTRQVGTSDITTFTHDYLNRLRFIDYPGATQDVTYTYDKNSNVETITNATSTIAYQYDSNDNMYFEQVGINGQAYTTGYGFNQLDNLDNITYHSGRVVSYSPDAFGRARTAVPYIDNIVYHPNSQIKQMDYANGQISKTKLNERRWVKKLSVTNGQADVIDLGYKYDDKGNVEKIEDNLDSNYSRKLKYDDADRLKKAEGQWGKTKFSYDSFGNIRKKKVNDIETLYNYNNNKLVQTTGTFSNLMQYDDYGNISSNGRHNFIYDDAGNLVSSRKPTIPGTPSFNSTSYKYDGNNMRVVRSRGGNQKHYLFTANGNQLGEYHPVTGYLKEHIYIGSSRIASAEDTPAIPPPPVVIDPVANAGVDVTFTEGITVTLDGTQSTPNTNVTYIWTQTAGPAVTLTGASTLTPSFVAPTGLYSATLSFALRVINQSNAYSIDSVTVTVSILDTDNDGLSDNFEIANFGDLTQTGTGDFDNDGISNLDEWTQGSNPTVVNEPNLTIGFFASPGNQQNTIYWVNDPVIQNYDLYWSTTTGVTQQTGTLVSNVSSPYVHTGLTNGQTYYYILVAKSSCCEAIAPEKKVTTGQGGWSDASKIGNVDAFAMNKAGQGISVWSETAGLFARRFDPTQGWLAAENFAVGTYDLSATNGVAKEIVDIDEDGDVVIVYLGNGQDAREGLNVIENNIGSGWSTSTLVSAGGFQNQAPFVRFIDNDYAAILVNQYRNNEYVFIMAEYRKGLGITSNTVNANTSYAFNSDTKGNALHVWYGQDVVYAKRYSAANGWSSTEKILDLDDYYKITCGVRFDSGNLSTSQQGYSVVLSLSCIHPQFNGSLKTLYTANYINNKWVKEFVSTGPGYASNRGSYVQSLYGDDHNVLLSQSGTVFINSAEYTDGSTNESIIHKTVQDISWSIPIDTSGSAGLWGFLDRSPDEGPYSMKEDMNGNLISAISDYVFTYSETNGLRNPATLAVPNSRWAQVINLSMSESGNGMLIRNITEQNSNLSNMYANHYTHIPGSPIANAGLSRKVVEGQTITLDGTGSSDVNGNITSYSWKQIGGTPVVITNANTSTATVIPQSLSVFELTVVDDQGLIQTDNVYIEMFSLNANNSSGFFAVENNIANAGSNQTVSEGDLVTLDGAASTLVSAYYWRQISGPPVQLADPFAMTTTFYSPQVASDTPFEFELVISNGLDYAPGSLSKSQVTVTVQDYTLPNQAPVANAGSDQSIIDFVRNNQIVTLAGNFSDADGSVTQYRWKQTSGPDVTLNNSNGLTPDFKASAGQNTGPVTYVFELSATDNHAVTTKDTVSVTFESRIFKASAETTNSYILNGYQFIEITLTTNSSGSLINFGFDVPLLPGGGLGIQSPFSVNSPYTSAYRLSPASYPERYSVPIVVQRPATTTGDLLDFKIEVKATSADGSFTDTLSIGLKR